MYRARAGRSPPDRSESRLAAERSWTTRLCGVRAEPVCKVAFWGHNEASRRGARMNAITQSRRHAAVIVALTLAAVFAPRVHAHHAFATEFDANLEGEVKGTVTRVWWQNPHIRYDVSMKMPDGSVARVGAAAAGQLADVSARELDRADRASRLRRHREGQLGPRRHEEALRHVHQPRQRPREGPAARPLRRKRGHRNAGHRRSERRLHRAREELPREHHGLLGQPLQVPSDGRRLPAETDAADAPRRARSTRAASSATTTCCAACRPGCRGSSARRTRCRCSTRAITI